MLSQLNSQPPEQRMYYPFFGLEARNRCPDRSRFAFHDVFGAPDFDQKNVISGDEHRD